MASIHPTSYSTQIQIIHQQEGLAHLRKPLNHLLGKNPTLQEKLGEGLEGVVYKEETASTSLPQYVAIKVFHKDQYQRLSDHAQGDVLGLRYNKDEHFAHTLAVHIEDPICKSRFILDNDNYQEMAKEVRIREKQMLVEKDPLLQKYQALVQTQNEKLQQRNRLQNELASACLLKFKLSKQLKKLQDELTKLNQAIIKLDEELDQIEDNHRFAVIATVMECLEGQDLLEAINNHKVQGDMQNYILQILKAVQQMHSKGVFHRDLKPENLYLENGVIKIMDFGFAKKIPKDPRMQTCSGTRSYMAPEVLCDRPYDNTVDLYAAGVILYAIAIGELPFDNKNEAALLRMIASYGEDGTSFEEYSGHNEDTIQAIARTKSQLHDLRERNPKLTEVIIGLTRAVPSHRMTLEQAIAKLENQ